MSDAAARYAANVRVPAPEVAPLELSSPYPRLGKQDTLVPIPYGELFPLFNCINIETTSWCNLGCAFCPSRLLRRPHLFMDEGLYRKIIENLARLDYRGQVRLHQSNEPLLDPRLEEKISFARGRLPRAQLGLSTNTLLLDEGRLEALFQSGLNFMASEAYLDKAQFDRLSELYHRLAERHPEVILDIQGEAKKGYSYSQEMTAYNKKGRFYITLSKRYSDPSDPSSSAYNSAQITSRCGLIESKRKITLPRICTRPFRTMQVNFDGTVLACCEEWTHDPRATVGNLRSATVEAVWNGRPLFELRAKLQDGARDEYPCSACNFGGGVYTSNIRRVTID